MNTFFLEKKEKTSPSPTLPFCMKTWRQVDETYYSRISSIFLGEIFVSFWKLQPSLRKSTKFVFEFCGLDPTGRLASVDTATLSCFNQDFLQFSERAPCPFLTMMLSKKFSTIYTKWKSAGNLLGIHFLEIIMQTFWWESLRGWDFRPQLTVVSGLFDGNPFVDRIFLGHNLLLSQAFSVRIPSWMGFF
jgi:hypothetical protein